jgi:aryl-alcohol dehydrogenase-like predicted oxidoreductase
MRYNQLGSTGLLVSELCLGTVPFGIEKGSEWAHLGALGQNEADAMVRTAVDAGINFIDTANVYAEGRSEEVVGQALRNLGIPRSEMVIATKVFGRVKEAPNQFGASRFHIMDQVKASLRRLQLDHIDLYQLHGWDVGTPIEEPLRAMEDLVRQGYVRYVGVSNWAAWQIMKGLGIADRRGFDRIQSVQAYYSIAGRDLERELVPMMESEGVGLMIWSPLASGLLSGKYNRDGSGAGGRRATFDFPPVDKDRAFDIIDVMRPLAEARGVSVAQIALAWLLHQPHVTSIIIGATRQDQLTDNIAATEVKLTPEELAALDRISALPPEYPGWMLTRHSRYRKELAKGD